MELQEAFNTVAVHLLKQGRRSVAVLDGHGEVCAYRGKGGLKCAFGVLIPDECYDPAIENLRSSALLSCLPYTKPWDGYSPKRSAEAINNSRECIREKLGLSNGPYDEVSGVVALIDELQDLHDNTHPQYWKRGLGRIAGRLGLSLAAIEECGSAPSST